MIDYKQFFLATARIESHFIEDIGNPRSGIGTGFWIFHKGQGFFVTNRHMIDLAHFDPKCQQHRLNGLYIWLREEHSIISSPIKFEINLNKTAIIAHPTADVAILAGVSYSNTTRVPAIHAITVSDRFASKQFFEEKLNPVDRCVFIGYPLNIGGSAFWDEATGLPIVRGAELSSYPPHDFIHKSINTSHARLVSGLSFGGSSGSPILNIGTPVLAGQGITIQGAVEPMIIGIMAGHWWNNNCLPDFVKQHSGLSYFVASTAIFDLLDLVLP